MRRAGLHLSEVDRLSVAIGAGKDRWRVGVLALRPASPSSAAPLTARIAPFGRVSRPTAPAHPPAPPAREGGQAMGEGRRHLREVAALGTSDNRG